MKNRRFQCSYLVLTLGLAWLASQQVMRPLSAQGTGGFQASVV